MKLQNNHKFNIGQNIDVKDSINKWVNGEIIFIRGEQLYIHYSGWSSKFNQYISIHSDRTLTQWQPGCELKINNRVDAFHPLTGWLEARVIDLEFDLQKESSNQVIKRAKVHYFNFHTKYDRWIDPNNYKQMDIIGAKSKAYGIGKSRLKKKSQISSLSELAKKVLQGKIKNMIQELNLQNYVIKNIQGDGNCLFRSISHQLYGSQDHHKQIRSLCMKYIQNERVFFQDYITQNIDEYIKRKSQDGIWGDDVQIQALSEIYSRPIEIYATSSKPLRTFHEDSQHQIQPIRLAYVGLCHYNSIKRTEQAEKGLLPNEFGEFQSIFIAGYQNRALNSQNSISQYRQIFSNSGNIDQALCQNVQASQRKQDDIFQSQLAQIQSKEYNQAIEISQAENIFQQIQNSQMKELQAKYEQDLIQEQLKKIEEREMQLAKELSKINKKPTTNNRPYWFQDLISQGFGEQQILFAIQINGYDADLVQNFLLDNM